MARKEIDVRVHTTASPAVVYALLIDGAGWPGWSPLGSFELERPGADEPEGVGAIRVFRTGRVTSRERVVERVPDRRFSYELLSGLPLRDYRADVDLTPERGGTSIRWHSTFTAKVPGTGWLYRRALGRFIGRVAAGLAAHAATTAARPS
ncbi:SRPBCC family protein [Plantactinospora sp. ZYX-F-223]|uniref:SRPBCC family protein n=1 Tax=Plantactinospora sp. ZYX-F-223 TaxID=3144103 RepID=UPI0031FDD648